MFGNLNMNTNYLLSDACDVLGIKPGRLQNWMKAGWIIPSVQAAAGSGTRNIFSYNDLVLIEMLKLMVEMGVPRKYAGELTKNIQNHVFYKDTFADLAREPYSYFEIYVLPDGRMETNITLAPDAFWISREKYKPTIVYSINLNHIIGKVELAVNGK